MTLDIRRITDTFSVAPQITPDDIDAIKAAGFAMLINNRPDNEEPGQPSADSLRDAAATAGLDYVELPVTPGGCNYAEVNATTQVIVAAAGPVLAFCRSGTRSCSVWALAEARRTGDPAAVEAAAGAAGYDLAGLRPLLDRLAAEGAAARA